MHKHDDNGNSIISQARACKGTQDDLVIALDQLSPRQLLVIRDLVKILNMPPSPETDAWLVCFWALLPDRLTDIEYAEFLQIWGL